MSNLVSYLFETNALKICPDNKPFWYTSGKIGPYYINTHFLYGSEQDAVNLLKFIDSEKENKETLPKKVFEQTFNHYNQNEIYKNVINEMITFIKENINVDEIDYISGGERRDWFFSNIVANILSKPHITIYKDLSMIVTDSTFEKEIDKSEVKGAKVLHIADLITEASSYIRAWIPVIKSLEAEIVWSTVVVDRMQGGKEKLETENVKSLSMINIDTSLFEKALSMNIINETQFEMLKNFYENPDETMRNFLIAHPEFLENALASDEKTAARAKLCIDSNLYNL
ncbi:MAG: orotate phosphoribosyltransferase [Clostridia bacterium]|nr:orotate phosphoribosyltransferase [Clostridia bacterium]